MRLIIEAPNGKIYYGALTEVIYLRGTMIEGEEPKRCENPQQVAEIIAGWYENLANINSAFTLTTKDGDVCIFPPEILKRCIPIVQAQPDILKRYVPESQSSVPKPNWPMGTQPGTGEHSSPGLGYEPEEGTGSEIPEETEE